jgi:hypothetical protein
MPRYHVRLRIDRDHCFHTTVPVAAYQKLSRAEIQRRARRQAVRAFGRQARRWRLIDAERGR